VSVKQYNKYNFTTHALMYIMVSASEATPAIPSKEVLLLQKEIFTLYLEPLLKIHNNDSSSTRTQVNNGNVITYEDLTSSFQLAVATLGKQNTNVDANGKKFVVCVFLFFISFFRKRVSRNIMFTDSSSLCLS
jgi:hypothetical protein